MIDCYIINLDRSPDRWERIRESPGLKRLNMIRVPAVDGQQLTLPCPEFSPWGYFWRFGRVITKTTIACNLSHVKTMQMFLDSGKEHALICEDDVSGVPELAEIIEEVLKYSDALDFVRFCGSRQKAFIPFADLGNGYQLVSDLRCGSCNGGYLVNRKAARILIKELVPMRLNSDIAIYCGIPNGIREATVTPFPIQLTEMNEKSTIGNSPKYPLFHPAIIRFATVIPYKFFTRTWRTAHRIRVGLMRKWLPPKKNGE